MGKLCDVSNDGSPKEIDEYGSKDQTVRDHDPLEKFGEHEIRKDSLYFCILENSPVPSDGKKYFTVDESVHYYPFCHDFGPFNMGVLYKFCVCLKEMMSDGSSRSHHFYVNGDSQHITNCIFLLASYLVLVLSDTAEEAWMPFMQIPSDLIVGFRDASHGSVDFTLSILDCLRGLQKARDLHFVSFDGGYFNVEEYDNLDDPANDDMHVLVPGRFVAFKGPTDEGVASRHSQASTQRGSSSLLHKASIS